MRFNASFKDSDMRLKAKFGESKQSFDAVVGEVIDLSEGQMEDAYQDGYAKGHEAGHAAGYEAGHADGCVQGYGAATAEAQALEDGIVQRTISGAYTNDRITILGSSIFRDCDSIDAISCSNVVHVDGRAIYFCPQLTTVDLPKAETFSDYAIYGCGRITSINVPRLRTTASQAMARQSALVKIELPSIEIISSTCFDRCSKLKTVVLSGNKVATLQGSAFSNTPIASGTGYVYVPDDLVEQYKTAWTAYADQIKPISELPK